MQKKLEEQINSLRVRVDNASQKDAIKIIAVSKKKNITYIKQAFELGVLDFGENYAQELKDKAINLPEANWHFIGPMQSNKVKTIAKYANWIHSLDREKIAKKINEECNKLGKTINCFIQINISGELTKSGIPPDELFDFAKYVNALESLELKGIMVLPSLANDPKNQMIESKSLHEELLSIYPGARYLSMGTTNDFESAIKYGSNMIRVGELIFGKR